MASGKFNMGKFNMVTEAEFTRLEPELSFLQVRATMSLQETLCKVKVEICENRKQVAHTRLESIAGAENSYNLMQVFGRGHQVTRNGAMVNVTRCQATEVLPRTHTYCTNEIPAILNGMNMFLDPCIPGQECGEGLQQPCRRTVGLRSFRSGHGEPHRFRTVHRNCT